MRVELYLYVQIPYRPEPYIIKPIIDHMLTPTPIGHIEVETFNQEEIFNICNWSCWTNEKPINLYSNIQSCGHGLMLIHPVTKKRYLSKSIGWLIGDKETINKYVEDNRYKLVWS